MRPLGDCTSLPGFIVYLVPWPLFLGIPRIKRTVPACLLRGRKKSLANAAASSASLGAFFSSSTCNANPGVPGLRWLPSSLCPMLLLSLLAWLRTLLTVRISSVHPGVFYLFVG